MKLKKTKISYLCYVIILIMSYIIYYSLEYKEYINNRSLNKDGFCIIYNPEYSNQTIDYPCSQLHDDVLNKLPPNYEFIDYIYNIKNASLTTFHRDVTSSQHTFNTKYPIYTLILYKYNGEFISVCPGSNKTYPFVLSNIINIEGKKGTAILFNSDLLHAGRPNNCKERNIIQYKICHKDDMQKLKHLHKINIKKESKCIINIYNKTMRKLSYFFEMPINYFAYTIMLKKEPENTFIGQIQKMIPLNYYNNI